MTDLAPLTALGAATPREACIGPCILRENSALALASLAVARDGTPPAPFGLELPGPGRCMTGPDGCGAFWTAPDQWMITAENRAETDFAAALQAAAPGARITEQTDGWVCFEIEAHGPDEIAALLERIANLAPDALAPGHATRTVSEHMSVFLLRLSDRRLAVLGMRTLAGSLWHMLDSALHRRA